MRKRRETNSLDKWDKLYISIKELRETQRKAQEKTDEQIRELREAQKKTDEQIKKTDERLKNRIEELTEAQGAFWESISKEGIKNFLQQNGYKIKRILDNVRIMRNGSVIKEFDTIFETEKDGKDEIFICEAKATAGTVKKFLKAISNIFEYIPEYKGKKIWGVFTSGRYRNGTERYAIRMGLLVFGVSGNVLVLLNNPNKIKPLFG